MLTTDPAAVIVLDAITADRPPTPFALTNALQAQGCNLRVREMMDGKLHVYNGTTQQWSTLDALAESLI
jgi:hypothetical protein